MKILFQIYSKNHVLAVQFVPPHADTMGRQNQTHITHAIILTV